MNFDWLRSVEELKKKAASMRVKAIALRAQADELERMAVAVDKKAEKTGKRLLRKAGAVAVFLILIGLTIAYGSSSSV